jgi:hypothetical protein
METFLTLQYETIKTFNNMNISLKEIDKSKISLSMKSLYERTERDVNEFLKTRNGLAYLRMKYPDFSIENAIKEYKSDAYAALNY